MTYGNVYVAQVAMGANEQHLITALKEAEAHHGPSILIAYAPCINHGISKGMSQAQLEEKLASECGYWPLWRYVPELKAEGKNPFILTSKEPNGQLLDFMMGETRFASDQNLPRDCQGPVCRGRGVLRSALCQIQASG